MTEKEKMLSGAMYNPSDPELTKARNRVRLLFHKFNSLSEIDLEERQKTLYQIFENAGENLFVEPPFYCDYGSNIKAGKNLYEFQLLHFGCCRSYYWRQLHVCTKCSNLHCNPST